MYVCDEAFYYPGWYRWPAWTQRLFGEPPQAQARKASGGSQPLLCRSVAFGWLASCRAAVAHPCEPGTLITALTLSLSWRPLPSAASTSIARRNDCFSFIRISLCYRRRPLVFQAFRLFPARLSPLALLFLYRFACPRLSASASLPLCAHVACCQLSAARACLPCPISIHLFPRSTLLPSLPF